MDMNTTSTSDPRPPLACRRCGCLAVRWNQTRAGKWYLAQSPLGSTGSNPAYAAAMAKVPHKCAGHTHHSVAIEQHEAAWAAAHR